MMFLSNGGGTGVLSPITPLGVASYSIDMGKGFMCYYGEVVYIFGTPFGQVVVPPACYCPVTIIDPTTSFNLSALSPGVEVVVTALHTGGLPAGASYTANFKWYRDRDGKLMFDWSYTIPDAASYGYSSWSCFGVYCYVGYVDPAVYGDIEINENGDYHVDISLVGGGESYSNTINFTVTGIEEPYAGIISRMELEYDGAQPSIPAYNIPQGKSGLVHIWGRNDMSTSQKLGIHWVVRGPPGWPDGPILEEYYDWQAFSTGPGDEHEFIGGHFNLGEAGLYDIRAGLLMNPDEPWYVHVYYGDLCTVVAVVPTISEFKISDYIKV